VGVNHADARITSDNLYFSQSTADRGLILHYFQAPLPLIDVIIYTYHLSQSMGFIVPGSMYSYYDASALFMRDRVPKISTLTTQSQKLEAAL